MKDYPPPKKKKGSESLPSPRSGYATTITVFFCSFTHLTIPRWPPKFNQFLTCTTQDPSIKFHPNPFITFWVMLSTDKQTNKQTNRQTNATKNITSFAKEVITGALETHALSCQRSQQYIMHIFCVIGESYYVAFIFVFSHILQLGFSPSYITFCISTHCDCIFCLFVLST